MLLQVIQGAGHHVYADQPNEFNKLVCQTCEKVDAGYYSFHASKKKSTSEEENYGDLSDPEYTFPV